jgi:nucleotide-binding universal stress UspA family protein
MVLGSVSAEVVDHAPCPVLVARSHQLGRVILGHDGSEFAQRAEQALTTLPIFAGVTVEIVTAVDLMPPWTATLATAGYIEPAGTIAREETQMLDEYHAVAEAAAERLKAAGLQATSTIAHGDAATALINAANDRQADLIVVGTHGRTGLQRLLLGSVARNVMQHAPCSVLVVRRLDRTEPNGSGHGPSRDSSHS